MVLRGTCERVALHAGDTLRKAKAEVLRVDSAEQHDIKLELDRRVQEQIRSEISQACPEDGFLGEEGGEGAKPGQREWVVDPIDGTVNLYHGIPHYAVSIACRLDGQTLAGAIYDPNRDEMFSAHRGGGSTCNGTAIQVSQRRVLAEAILALGFSKGKKTIEKCLSLYQHYGDKVRKLRAMGSAALDLAYVASGRLDAYIEQGVSLWDVAAGALMVEEAGGKVRMSWMEPGGKIHLVASSGRIDLDLV
ncbi:MAG: inositol monophosphatase [Verrucomicrobia bacterium]|nr:inositol monophosphatase [Pseudomonadota bacterium]NBS49386.1 inositol monophosphatase [Verrucomicrobiota bacterium]NBS78215.1 inositol monophosphatase [bacterium]NBT23297.1 inositol monophosphatase [bacterium]NBY66940.1 inositol monophosphatase [Verrucomicrobiota bacterium]